MSYYKIGLHGQSVRCQPERQTLRMRRKDDIINKFLIVAMILATVACSTKKNTSKSRWWHSFNTRYNVYYNASQAYVDGSLEKENGHSDNFTEIIPLYVVGNKESRELGKGNFDRSIEKCEKAIKLHSIKKKPEWTKSRRKTQRDLDWLNRKEYNPFMWKVWMLMGRAQFHQGAFDEAASTFAYMSRLYQTQPAIYGRARAWLAKCYIEQGWMYDAEDVIRNMQRDTLHWRAEKEWNYTFADYYIHLGDYEKAIPYLKKVIKQEMRRKQKAREWYLLGQLYAELGQKDLAYKAFGKVIRLNPPYELDFNAKIAQTEVAAGGKAKQTIAKLKRMAASDKNAEFLDQVYYAIGNIYLAERDTLQALGAYEKGNEKSTRNGIEKGVLLLKLGDLYWQREQFADAGRCYGEAIGLLDKDREDYELLSERSKILDELTPHTETIHLQDSLQALAEMPEKERNEAIDRVIEALKKKEKEEKRSRAAAQQGMEGQGGAWNEASDITPPQSYTDGKTGTWYFYNPLMVGQGKAQFQQLWGRRENVDNWQRVNKTVVAQMNPTDEWTDEQRDSIANAFAKEDSIRQQKDSLQNNPHKREYYLAQIPFTEEQKQQSNELLKDALYHSGVIFKDKLRHFGQSEKQFNRLLADFPDFGRTDDVYYHLYLLYSRLGRTAEAEACLEKLKRLHPESQWTALLSDPYFKENAVFGVHIEDSLYTATYNAFKEDRYDEVLANARLSEKRFPLGENRDKFLFVSGLSELNRGNATTCLTNMQAVVENYPQSSVSEMAGMIVNGARAGRRLKGGKFDVGDVWDKRSEVLNDNDSVASRELSTERNTPFSFVIAYHPDSIQENQLLFELAKFNFTHFLVRNFDISIEDVNGVAQMKVDGFQNYDEALQYARQLYSNRKFVERLRTSRTLVVSKENMELIGRQFSYQDYETFYKKYFLPLKISKLQLLNEPAEIEYEHKEEPAEELDENEGKAAQPNSGFIMEMENEELEPKPKEGGVAIEEAETTAEKEESGVAMEEGPKAEEVQSQEPGVEIEEGSEVSEKQEETVVFEELEESSKTTVETFEEGVPAIEEPNASNEEEVVFEEIPAEKTEPQKPAAPNKPQPARPSAQKTAPIKPGNKEAKAEEEFVIDDFGTAKNAKNNQKGKNQGTASKTEKKELEAEENEFYLEDEYFELEGF